jgi:hypothetical protein
LRRTQRGYLFEIPLILTAVFLALALILPRLPGLGRKILLAVATVPTLVCLFYLIVLPGWTPGTPLRGRPTYRLALFLACAAATVAAVAVFILR